MPDKKGFDLGDYIEVKDRIAMFYELYGNGRLVTDEVTILTDPANKQRVMVKALAYRTPDDPHPAVGYSWMELPGTTSYTKGSELENTETSAWGRAIAALGILIDRSIASGQEVKNKQTDEKPAAQGAAEQRTTHRDGLIGKAIAQGTQDFQLRQGPDGPVLPFRIKEGRLSQIAVASGDIAQALDTFREAVIGQRVTVWGHYTDESYPKKDPKTGETVDITYKVLHVERIATPDWILPAPVTDTPLRVVLTEPEEAPPLWEPLDEDERAAIGGGLPA